MNKNEVSILSNNFTKINNLTKLCLDQCIIDNESSVMLFDNITCLEELEILSIRKYSFTNECINVLSNNLSLLCCLNEIELESIYIIYYFCYYYYYIDNSFTEGQCVVLFSSLPTVKYLSTFTFQYNILSEDEFLYLKNQLVNVKRLKVLNLFGTNLVGKCSAILYELFLQHNSIRKVKIPDTIKCSLIYTNTFPKIDFTFSSL